ncbi:MAG: hypothetical protein K2G01_08200 [Paramuribaculum sp.]|nr:hypothetical protein [Paramuribaculum sp.]
MITITLTADSMLRLWKTAKGFEPLRTDCIISRSDGPDLDRILTLQMRSWYVGQLMNGQLRDLPLTDIGPTLSFDEKTAGCVSALLPERCLRVASADCDKWERPAIIINDRECADAVAQTNPFARAGEARPVAIADSGRLTLYPATGGTTPRIMAVMLPDSDDIYRLTPSMLASIGASVSNLFPSDP